MRNALGDFEFVNLHALVDSGAPPTVAAQMGAVFQWEGTAGSSVQRLGKKGKPFQMRSAVDVATFAAGVALLRDYFDAANAEALPLIYGGIHYGFEFGTLYLPLEVEPIRVRPVSGTSGGLLGAAAGAWVEALWTLLPIAVT